MAVAEKIEIIFKNVVPVSEIFQEDRIEEISRLNFNREWLE